MPKPDFPYTYRIINLDLTNGLIDEHFPIHAEAIYYHWGTSILNVKLNTSSSDVIKLRPKNRIEAPVKRLFISADARAETIQLFLSNPKEITLGGSEVRVVTDTGFYNTMDRQTYVGSEIRAPAAANFSVIYITNPLASNMLAVLDSIHYQHYANGVITANSIIYGWANVVEGAINTGWNKYIGDIAPVCRVSSAFRAGNPCTTQANFFAPPDVQGSVSTFNHFILPPGYTFYILPDSQNVMIGSAIHWREIPIIQ